MGIKIYPQILKKGLVATNIQLNQIINNAWSYIKTIEEFVETEQLDGIAFKNQKEYMNWGHVVVVKSQIKAMQAFISANQTHINLIDQYLGEESYISEEFLSEQCHRIQNIKHTSQKLQLFGIYTVMDELESHVQKKLERLYEYEWMQRNLYSSVMTDVIKMETNGSALHGVTYDRDTGKYLLSFVDSKGIIGADTEKNFKNNMKEQFGFDDKTSNILWNVYAMIQKEYSDLPQKERDWYFSRAISQLGDYNSKKVNLGKVSIETNAWRKGAGWVYEYNDEEDFFCNKLGLNKKDYKYLRQMVRLQHFMTSDADKYSAEALKRLYEDDKEGEYIIWKQKMEDAKGKNFKNDMEYIEYYELLYSQMGNKGDFSHMMYTISSNLIEKGHRVDNNWINVGAMELSWNDANMRKDITGWLGDALYKGSGGETSFKQDDYIADLDADNIANRVNDKTNLVDVMNQYYKNIAIDADKKRTEEFLANNSYEDVEKVILEKIGTKDNNRDGKVNIKDLNNDDSYKDTYDFLKKLKDNKKAGN